MSMLFDTLIPLSTCLTTHSINVVQWVYEDKRYGSCFPEAHSIVRETLGI